MNMTNLTLAIPDELHTKMKRHSDIRWSEVVRKSIAKKVEMLDIMDRIAQKSKLTQKDADEISHKIKKDIFEDLNKK
ncbi:hypothetical protein HYX10_00855 [Candidatus Woesearchaeota archaeon]|nr:hypothetical protein [Candidatus Woesearchaeota archaeon]